MSLWFELGIDRLNAFASTDGSRLMGVGEFKRRFGATTAQVNAYKRLCSNTCVGGEKLKVNAKAEAWTGNMLTLISPVTARGKELEGQRTLWDAGAMERHNARSEELGELVEREGPIWHVELSRARGVTRGTQRAKVAGVLKDSSADRRRIMDDERTAVIGHAKGSRGKGVSYELRLEEEFVFVPQGDIGGEMVEGKVITCLLYTSPSPRD